MNLSELKKKSASDLIKVAESIGLDNMARSRKQDIIFSILKNLAKKGRLRSVGKRKEEWN